MIMLFDAMLSTLIIISTLLLLIGLIKPKFVVRWGTKRTRRRVILYYGGGVIALFLLLAATLDPNATVQGASSNEPSEATHVEKTEPTPIAEEVQEKPAVTLNYNQEVAKSKLIDWLGEHEFPGGSRLTLGSDTSDEHLFQLNGKGYHRFYVSGLKDVLEILIDPDTAEMLYYENGNEPISLNKWYNHYLTANRQPRVDYTINSSFRWVEPLRVDGSRIIGTIKNTSKKSYDSVYVKIGVYDADGVKIDTLARTIDGVPIGGTFRVSFVIPNDEECFYRLDGIQGL